jgi:UDP-N-acetylmuramoyl-tripeptide--D-alanyl-D-alanine ligase
MTYLCSIATPEIGIATAVSYSHLEYFGSVANIKKEKQVLIEKVINKGLAVLNYDNEFTREMSEASHARVITYGLKEGADLQAQNIAYNFSQGDYELAGLHFKMSYGGSIVPVFMKNVLSEPAIYAGLAGAAVGLYFGMNLVEIAEQLNNFNSPVGRMNLIAGYNHSFLIDDTYNSNPAGFRLALSQLKAISSKEKILITPGMIELGDLQDSENQKIAAFAATICTHIIIIGQTNQESLQKGIKSSKKSLKIFTVPDLKSAQEIIPTIISKNSAILFENDLPDHYF